MPIFKNPYTQNVKSPEDQIDNIFDLLTPEEKAQYAKSFQPTTQERVLTGIGGLADVISSAGGGRNDHYYGKDLQERSDNRIKQDMQFVGNELTRKYAERQAKAAAEKAAQESAGVGEELGTLFDPKYFDNPDIGTESKFKVADYLKYREGLQNQKDVQAMKPKPQGKDMTTFWRLSAKDAIGDERVKRLYEQTHGFEDVKLMLGAVKEKNSIAAAGIGKKVATAMGEGARTTDEDVIRYVKSGKFSQSLLDKYNKWVTGVPTDVTQQEILDMVTILADKVNQRYAPVYREHTERAAAIQGVPYEEASMKMNLPFVSDKYGWSSSTTPTVVKKGYNSKSDETQLIYSDGSKKIVKGRQ